MTGLWHRWRNRSGGTSAKSRKIARASCSMCELLLGAYTFNDFAITNGDLLKAGSSAIAMFSVFCANCEN